jgi:hypothetical protein
MKTARRKCERCGIRFNPPGRGRPPRFCGRSCRQAHYVARREQINDPNALLQRDLNHILVRGAIRQEIWSLLRQIGVVSDPDPPKPTDPPRDEILRALRKAGLVPPKASE